MTMGVCLPPNTSQVDTMRREAAARAVAASDEELEARRVLGVPAARIAVTLMVVHAPGRGPNMYMLALLVKHASVPYASSVKHTISDY